jgi:hypothetical protein
MKGAFTVDKKQAEVFYWMAEYAAERSQWFQLCRFLNEKGILPKQIADAVNAASKAAGYSQLLTPGDCE